MDPSIINVISHCLLRIHSSNLQQIGPMKSSQNSQKVEESAPINDFNGHYQFLNNDHPAWAALDSVLYPSVAIAYQAARTDNPSVRQALNEVETYEAFRELAVGIVNPSDWGNRRFRVMQKLVRDKFKRSRQLGGKLIATHPRSLINTFREGGENQQFWGVINGKGQNTLGKILMAIREQIQKGTDWQRWILDQGIENHQKMRPILSLIIIKDDKPSDKLFLQKKSKFFFGSHQINEIKLQHPSISKVHACIYFGLDLNVMLVDLGSSNGTTLTRDEQVFKLETMKPIKIQNGDTIVFGLSSRKYRVEIDCTIVEKYMKQQQGKVEVQVKRGKQEEKRGRQEEKRGRQEEKRSRSRSRSPRHRRTRN